MICGDCAILEGQIHEEGCDQEICPKCKRQLLSCGCFENIRWESIPNREPFFSSVFCCERCGETMPNLKMVSDEKWGFICSVTYPKDCILCEGCMDEIYTLRKEEKEDARRND